MRMRLKQFLGEEDFPDVSQEKDSKKKLKKISDINGTRNRCIGISVNLLVYKAKEYGLPMYSGNLEKV